MGDNDDLRGRVMVLERIINQDIPLIREYIQSGYELRIANAGKLSSIDGKLDATADYQRRCDKERDSMHEDIEEIAGRTTTLEKWQSNIGGSVTMRSSIVSGVVTAVTLGLAALGLKFK